MVGGRSNLERGPSLSPPPTTSLRRPSQDQSGRRGAGWTPPVCPEARGQSHWGGDQGPGVQPPAENPARWGGKLPVRVVMGRNFPCGEREPAAQAASAARGSAPAPWAHTIRTEPSAARPGRRPSLGPRPPRSSAERHLSAPSPRALLLLWRSLSLSLSPGRRPLPPKTRAAGSVRPGLVPRGSIQKPRGRLTAAAAAAFSAS